MKHAKCTVVMLQTDKASSILKGKNLRGLAVGVTSLNDQIFTGHHLYVVSEDPIRVGDYYIALDMKTKEYGLLLCDSERIQQLLKSQPGKYKKVIATSDQFIKSPTMPGLSLDFLLKYCEAPNDNTVLIVEEQEINYGDECNHTGADIVKQGLRTYCISCYAWLDKTKYYRYKVDTRNRLIIH